MGMKLTRIFSAISLFVLVAGLVSVSSDQAAQAAPINAYIKGSSPTVYWYASNGKRYVFPNGQTFASWQPANNPAAVTTVSDVELYTLPIGGNMTYRPGARLLKITTDPKVYAVSRYGVLRWVTSESVAQAIYGQNWNQMVNDLPDDFFANYSLGTPIYSGTDYNASNEYNAVSSPSDNISTQASVGNGSNQVALTNMYVDLTANRETVVASDTNRNVTLTATVTNPSLSVDQLRIRIYDRNLDGANTDLLLATCDGTVTCAATVSLPLQTNTYSRQYLAEIANRTTGQRLAYNPNMFLQAQGSGTNTTPTPSQGSDACIQGYVWREAFTGDHVCVTTDVRTQAALDNAQAASRVSPNGGFYGPDTCIQGYVWRGARPEDHVCVLGWVRDQTDSDNALAASRRVTPVQGRIDSVILTANRSVIRSGDTVSLTATASNNSGANYSGYRLVIRDNITQNTIQTCNGVATCSANLAVTKPSNYGYAQYAVYVFNPNNTEVARAYAPIITFTDDTPATVNARLDVNRTSIASSEMTTFTFTAPSNIPVGNVYAEFYKENMGPMVWSCSGQQSCTGSAANWSNGYASTQYRAVVYNRPAGQTQGSYVTTVYSPRINFTSYDVCPSSVCTYAITPGPLATGTTPPPTTTNGVFTGNTTLQGSITERWTHGSGETVEYHANLISAPSNLNKVTIRVYDTQTNQQLWKDCTATTECAFTLTSLPRITRTLIARATDSLGNVISSNVITVTYGTQDSQTDAFRVTSVTSALDQTKANRCNEGFGAVATLTANGAGTVKYQWQRSDGAIAPIETASFTQAGSQNLYQTWFLSGNYNGWLRLHVISPNDVTSNQTAIVSQCQSASTLSGSVYTSTDPGQARAGDMVRVDARLQMNQSVANVRVEIYNQDGQGIKTCWNVANGDFCQAFQARIPTTASGTYQFYAQAVDGNGNTLKSNWFPVQIMQ